PPLLLLCLLHFGCSAVALRAASGRPIPLCRTTAAQFTAAAANRVTPGGLGAAAVNTRYLVCRGLPLPRAAVVVAVVQAAGVAAHLLLLAAVLGAGGGDGRVAGALRHHAARAAGLVPPVPLLIGAGVLRPALVVWGRRAARAPAVSRAAEGLTALGRRARAVLTGLAGAGAPAPAPWRAARRGGPFPGGGRGRGGPHRLGAAPPRPADGARGVRRDLARPRAGVRAERPRRARDRRRPRRRPRARHRLPRRVGGGRDGAVTGRHGLHRGGPRRDARRPGRRRGPRPARRAAVPGRHVLGARPARPAGPADAAPMTALRGGTRALRSPPGPSLSRRRRGRARPGP